MTKKGVLATLISGIFGLVLVALIAAVDPTVLKTFADGTRDMNFGYAGLFALLTLVNIWLTAYKWKILSLSVSASPEKLSCFSFRAYTAVNAAVSQFLPPTVATVGVRSLAMKAYGYFPIKAGVALSLFDKFFDLIVLLPMLAGAVCLFIGNSTLFALMVFVSSIFLCGIGVIWLVSSVQMREDETGPLWYRKVESVLAATRSLRKPKFLALIYGLSALRAGVLFARVLAAALAVKVFVTPIDLFTAFPFAQLTALVPVTPANLGIAEWTWVGVLSGVGITYVAAAAFALAHRMLHFVSVIVAGGAGMVYLISTHQYSPRPFEGSAEDPHQRPE